MGADGFVGRWKLPTFQAIKEGIPERQMEYRSCDFILDSISNEDF